MASDARQRMIEGTVRLLARRGPQATSFAEVLALTGAPRGSIYHHFPGGKDQLVSSALDEARAWLNALLEELQGAPPQQVAERFLALWRSVLTRADLTAGCAVLAVTVATESETLLTQAGEIFKEWRTHLADLLTQGGLPPPTATAYATTLIAAAEGAVVISRAERSLEPFDLVAKSLLTQLAPRSATDQPRIDQH